MFIILFFVLVTGIFFALLHFNVKELSISYPYDETLFPNDIAAPTFRWDDKLTGASNWIIRIEFMDTNKPLEFHTTSREWTPRRDMWDFIKEKSLEKTARLTIIGFKKVLYLKKILSKNTISIKTSIDVVDAPIFFRTVPLPFIYALEHMEQIKWYLGDISSEDPPTIILEYMPVCGNCHSFTADGSVLGMDVDYANDKGSYIITEVSEDIMLTKDKIITWHDYKREDNELTFGLLSQISPRGKYVVSTVKDRSVFVPKSDPYYSQLFFPLKGILAYYDMKTKSFNALTGADDRNYVQSNPTWSPDGNYIVFARSKADLSFDKKVGNMVLLKPEQCEEYLTGKKYFRYDLYRIPFNNGKGGKAIPIEGASKNGMSNYFPKYSPDGKWIVFCKSNSFMLLQPDSKLYIMPADGGEAREMRCNTTQMNSWHSWSPNGKWLVFASKAYSPYTQLFLTHIDEEGNDTPPVLLSNFTPPERAANIPEFVNIKPDGLKNMHQSFLDYYSYARKSGDFIVSNKFEEAEYLLRKSLEDNPNYAKAHRLLGYVLTQMNRINEAEKEFKDALVLDPENALTYEYLGELYLKRKEYDKAYQALSNSIKYDSSYASAYVLLGQVLFAKGDIYGAQVNFETAVTISPELAYVHYQLGKIYMVKKEYKKAELSFSTVLKYTQDVDTICLLGSVHFYMKDYDKAVEYFEDALRIDPNNIDAHYNLGIIYLNNKEYDKAERYFRTVYKANPNDSSICFLLGKVLSMKSETIPEAISMYNKALYLTPSNTQGYIELGNLYLNIRDSTRAIKEFEKAIALDPNSDDIKTKIDNLQQQ